ncbi:MAG TPA: MerR family transcriptional regulator [Mobilitalea sp.]|nr:MerR family transcriptional regulator [Mobilitalea sp.]
MNINEYHYCKEKTPDTLYKIGMFASMNHVTIKALRYYDDENLLKPKVIDTETNYRYYTLSQMGELHQILALKEIGFRIDEIKAIISGLNEKDLLRMKRNQLMMQIADLTKLLAKVEQALDTPVKNFTSHVLIKSLPEVIIASMTRRIDSYDDLFVMMPEMGHEMERLGCECARPEYCFISYPEPGYKEERVLIEACETVTELKDDTDKIKFKIIPEVPHAACIFHKGSYNTLSSSYESVLHYIEENGLMINSSIRENHIDGVWNKDSEDEWLTEIQIPVCKVGK